MIYEIFLFEFSKTFTLTYIFLKLQYFKPAFASKDSCTTATKTLLCHDARFGSQRHNVAELQKDKRIHVSKVKWLDLGSSNGSSSGVIFRRAAVYRETKAHHFWETYEENLQGNQTLWPKIQNSSTLVGLAHFCQPRGIWQILYVIHPAQEFTGNHGCNCLPLQKSSKSPGKHRPVVPGILFFPTPISNLGQAYPDSSLGLLVPSWLKYTGIWPGPTQRAKRTSLSDCLSHFTVHAGLC